MGGKKGGSKRTSSIAQHKRVGKVLVPPMMSSMLNLKFSSWINSRLAEMLWACLVVTVIPRQEAIEIFRVIASLGFPYRGSENSKGWDLTHSSLANSPEDTFFKIIKVITKHPLGYAALRPLLLIESLPNRELWKRALNIDPQPDDWHTLSTAVAHTLNHQSQESTDIRWLTVMFKGALGKLSISPQMKEKALCLVRYPYYGEMKKVMPFIRATELGMRLKTGEDLGKNWSEDFWLECLKKTDCAFHEVEPTALPEVDYKKFLSTLHESHLSLYQYWSKTISTTNVDAKHDAVFGYCFYALSLVLELLFGQNRHGITGRLILRTLVECRISLAYLLFKNQTELWVKFRCYGAGQAKLALLKFNEYSKNKPLFINEDVLENLANEDSFQEFVNIDLGHWCGLDLRKMAELSGTKEDYDKYYGWASIYVHGHWPALRNNCYSTCLNPLHRLHRTPTPTNHLTEDSLPDAINLVNRILCEAASAYPENSEKLVLLNIE